MQVIQAILIGSLASYFTSDITLDSTRDAYITAVAIAISVFGIGFLHAWSFFWAQEIGESNLYRHACAYYSL